MQWLDWSLESSTSFTQRAIEIYMQQKKLFYLSKNLFDNFFRHVHFIMGSSTIFRQRTTEIYIVKALKIGQKMCSKVRPTYIRTCSKKYLRRVLGTVSLIIIIISSLIKQRC